MKLSDSFIKPLAYTRLFLDAPNADDAEFRQRIEQQLAEARLSASDAGIARSEIESAMFAVVAWIDESVMCSEWSGAALWRRKPLQKIYFNTTKAGVEFFSRLDELHGNENDVREVFFLCLSLGFKGQYSADGGRFKLEEIKARELKTLLGNGSPQEHNALLFPEAYAQASALPTTRRWRPTRTMVLLLLAPLSVLLVLYIVFALVLTSQVNDFLRLMQ